MNKLKFVLTIFISLFLLTSCVNNDSYNIDESIVAPSLNNLSFAGSWKVKDKVDLDDNGKLPLEGIENIYITNNLVEIGSIYTLKPRFESKFVNAKNYFENNLKNMDYFDLLDIDNLEVIVISDEDGFYQEIVRISEEEIMIVYNKSQYLLERKSNNVEESVLQKYKDGSKNLIAESFYGKLGLNITIRNQYIDKDDSLKTYYKTYYICYDNSNSTEMHIEEYVIDDIFLFKKDSYNLVKYVETWDNNIYEGTLKDYIIMGKNDLNLYSNLYSSNTPFELNYISNKYYSFAKNDENNSSSKQYRIKKLNGKESDDSYLNIEDIAGEEGHKIIKTLINKENENNNMVSKINSPIDNYINIGIMRNNGFWEYKTSLVLGEDPQFKYMDYTINIIPNIDLAKNKIENFKWSEILKKNPNAIDIVYSPEKKYFVILDKEYLSFYSSFKTEPFVKVKMDDTDKSIIKYDWILGANADMWKENFLLLADKPEE